MEQSYALLSFSLLCFFSPCSTHGHGHDFSPVEEEGYRSTPYQNLSSSEREQSYMPNTHISSINSRVELLLRGVDGAEL
jgi:hypothetical protein